MNKIFILFFPQFGQILDSFQRTKQELLIFSVNNHTIEYIMIYRRYIFL